MSKINAVRIINLNYNNNAIRISDEIFQMGGKSTLLSLRNGGGKSVLVQMMTAPFVHKQYRKTKDRPFESYFTTSKPTFILVEWVLDQGAGYCLTGMMVRKNQAPEEQSSEPLEIIQFISEYSGRCEYDVYNLPVVDKSKNEVILKNYNACKQLFDMYKRDHSKKFFCYDMNNYAQSRQYFEKLAEYKIDYKEWESIIRKVNLKESGLSELFSDCKNEKELIEKWFLDTIQNKLNHDQNRIKEFQKILDKYIRMYKDNKSKIERRDTILKFNEEMLQVEQTAKDYQETERNVYEMENRIACFVQELNRIEGIIEDEKEELEKSSKECGDKMSHILLEKLSMEIYQLKEELEIHITNRDMIMDEMSDLKCEIESTEKMVHLYECAKQQQTVDEVAAEYAFLTQKIDVYKKEEKDLEPERKKIGGYLKNYYSEQLKENHHLWEEKEKQWEKTEQQRVLQKKREEECEKQIKELLSHIAACRAIMSEFSKKEDVYNRKYKEAFARNILGNYESGMLEIKHEQYQKQLEELVRSSNAHASEIMVTEEKKKTAQRKKEDIQNNMQENRYQLRILSDHENALREQMRERQNIMRYLDTEDTMLWKKEVLLEVADRKLTEIERVRGLLEQEKNNLSKECKKMTSGRVLDLPQEFLDLMNELELHPVYGLEWLNRNGYSVEQNEQLVRKQPFLPYSLILSKKEISKLEGWGKEIYTSFPIPLIPRESLETALVEKEKSIINLSGIHFYLWFNEKLLNEEELRLLITDMEMKIKKKNDQIQNKNKEYAEYMERRSVLKNQTLSREEWENNQRELVEKNDTIEQLKTDLITVNEEISALDRNLEDLSRALQREKQDVEWCKERGVAFEQFCVEYKEYQEQRVEKEEAEKKKSAFEQEKAQIIISQQQLAESLKSLENEKQIFLNKEKTLKDKMVRFERYEGGINFATELQPEELEARYDAITTQMSVQLQDLELRQENVTRNLLKEKQELEKKMKKYQVFEREWKEISYDEKEQNHQEILLEDMQRKYKRQEDAWHREDKEVYSLDSRIQDKKKGMYEQCGCEEPIPKAEIQTVDFDAALNKLKYQNSEIIKQMKQADKHLASITNNLTTFSEYQDFVVKNTVVWDEKIEEMDEKHLRDFSGIIRRDYRQIRDEQKRKKDGLEAILNAMLRKDLYQEDYYIKPLEAMLSVTNQAELVLAQLQTTIQSYNSQMEKLAIDIAMVENEKSKINGLLEDYVKEVHINMDKIDSNSTITIRERPIKMLRIQIPDWDENEGLYRQRLDDFVDELTQNGIDIYEKNENALDYLSSRITTKNLYDSIIGVGNVQIKLYKIEESREYPITWNEVAKNSGGEGFLSAFVILSSLLYYMRKDDTDIFADRNEGKVLVMDNPFAQTNAAHLLKPLMDMAKKTNTQLICLSGLGGESIYSRFDNIYVLNLLRASLRGDMQYLRGEHTRGAEEETMVASHIEVMEQQSFLF